MAIYVLAGVNGAGKSSIGGATFRTQNADYYNPDEAARKILSIHRHLDQKTANAHAWEIGRGLLEKAIAENLDFAFETTLGGSTIVARLRAAAVSHDVAMWFCGLASPEQHIARVRARVAAGGHDIAEDRIRQRYRTSREHLVELVPQLSRLRVFDNSAEVLPGQAIPDPVLLLDMADGRVRWPTSADDIKRTPEWAKPLLAAAWLR